MITAPIALFVYNRPWHTQQTVEALLKNAEAAESDLIIFSDAAKDDDGQEQVEEVRQYLGTITGFKSIRIVEQEKNMGLAQSIISGVTDVVDEHGRIIVLEDDLVTSPYFLKYMNDGLTLYENDDQVISVHAYSFPIEGLPETFFIKGASCWGWATWKCAWELFEPDGEKLLSDLEKEGLLERFDMYGTFAYKRMLEDQVRGENDSWAVRWYASALLANKLSLHPGCSLLENIGLDGTGSHCGSYGGYDTLVSDHPVGVVELDLEENKESLERWANYFAGLNKGFLTRLIDKTKRSVRGLWRCDSVFS